MQSYQQERCLPANVNEREARQRGGLLVGSVELLFGKRPGRVGVIARIVLVREPAPSSLPLQHRFSGIPQAVGERKRLLSGDHSPRRQMTSDTYTPGLQPLI